MDYKKLFADQQAGKLDPDMVLYMDNDDGYWHYEKDVSEETQDRMRADYLSRYGEPNGYEDLVKIVRAAGVNCDWV